MDVSEALADFLDEQAYRGNSEETLRWYRKCVRYFCRETETRALSDLTTPGIRSWLVAHRHLSPSTLSGYDRALRSFCTWLHRRGYLGINPMATLPKPRVRPQELPTFSQEDLQAILSAAQAGRCPMRDRALLYLLLDTGVRIGEATGLTLPDIAWKENLLNVDGKTGRRPVPFGRHSKRALRTYLAQERRAISHHIRSVFLTRSGTPLSNGGAIDHVRQIAIRAGVKGKKLGPHTFRHTFALEYIRAGGDAFTLQRILGHSSLEMTRRYVNLAKEDLVEAHRRFSPGDRLLQVSACEG